MSITPRTTDEIAETKRKLLWFGAMASLLAILMVSIFAWIDSQKVPSFVLLGKPETELAVDIRGAISTPGVVIVEPGDRLIDVVNRAGGLAPNADQRLINMSVRVSDGQMIVLPTQAPPGAYEQDGLININTASAEDLKLLPGIGDVLAMRIVAHRETNGPYQSVDDLVKVDGISQNLIENIRPFIRVSGDD